MPRINKIKRDKAISALRKAGAGQAAASLWRLLDLEQPLEEQIIALAEEDPELFDAPDTDDTSDDKPMTAAEAKAARAKGAGHLQGMIYRRKAEPRPSTASASAREAAEHLVSNSKTSPPPVRKYIEPVRDINAGHAPVTRQRSASAEQLAARLRGN